MKSTTTVFAIFLLLVAIMFTGCGDAPHSTDSTHIQTPTATSCYELMQGRWRIAPEDLEPGYDFDYIITKATFTVETKMISEYRVIEDAPDFVMIGIKNPRNDQEELYRVECISNDKIKLDGRTLNRLQE